MAELNEIVDELLADFYRRRIEKINSLQLKETLSRKNPYLYKAMGLEDATEMVREIVSAFMSSSDEGIFGDAFFEPLAKRAGNGIVGHTEGIDVIIEDDNTYKAIAVKSGPNAFNASSRNKQADNFVSLRSRVAKIRKYYDAIVGYGYGKKHTELNRQGFRELAGQSFWQEITDDPDFYLKVIDEIDEKAQKHLVEYKKAYEDLVSRFTAEFKSEFCFDDGSINWHKLVKFNSGKSCEYLVARHQTRTIGVGDKVQLVFITKFPGEEPYEITGSIEIEYQIVSGEDVVNVSEDGIVTLKDNAEPGSIAKIIATFYGKSRMITIKVSRR